jgi:hypothetical protein
MGVLDWGGHGLAPTPAEGPGGWLGRGIGMEVVDYDGENYFGWVVTGQRPVSRKGAKNVKKAARQGLNIGFNWSGVQLLKLLCDHLATKPLY